MPLRDKFKRLFQLEQNKDIMIKDRVSWQDGRCVFIWMWSREPRGRTKSELVSLAELLNSHVGDSNNSDAWKWTMASNGVFTMKKLNQLIIGKVLEGEKSQPETKRNSLVPENVEVFICRTCKKSLLVLMELDKRGFDLHSVRCPICDDDIETINHALIFYKIAYEVWSRVYKWWGLGPYVNVSINETFAGSLSQNYSELGMKIWQGVEWICGYVLWKNRNLKIFKKIFLCIPSLVSEIQVLSFDYISHRLKDSKLDWCTWLLSPRSYLTIK
ncbi:uncharacterized protein [Rutidosis leptorrhynchoides]|uniref:uncharacterized protein n=1 Tax=Rutidosis leptorrhynchoides TaxID=125765 RepID=UPI003A995B2D